LFRRLPLPTRSPRLRSQGMQERGIGSS
jgi:hypothetical protein